MVSRLAVMCSLILLAGCGSDSPEKKEAARSVAVTGPLAASNLRPSAFHTFGSCTRASEPVQISMSYLMFSTAPDLCGALAGAIAPANSTTAFVAFGRIASGDESAIDPSPPVHDTYTVIAQDAPLPPSDGHGSKVAYVTVEKHGAPLGPGDNCEGLGLAYGVSGTVTFDGSYFGFDPTTGTTLTGDYGGSVDVILDDGGRLQGSFMAPLCADASDEIRADCTPVAIPTSTTCG